MDEAVNYLFNQYLSGEITEDELLELKNLLESNPGLKEEFELLKSSWNNFSDIKNLFNEDKGFLMVRKKISDHHKKRQLIWRMAAIFIGIMMIGGILYVDSNNEVSITARSNVKEIYLPDSSMVFLNKGAVLTYKNPRFLSFNREVSLTGEGFFEITHNSESKPFIVSTNAFDIYVLGTKFNAIAGEDETKVILTEGSVKLINFDNRHKEMLMEPGDLVKVNNQSRGVSTDKVNPDLYSIWKENRIVFDHFSLEEVVRIIQNVFDKEVIINSNNSMSKHLNGSAPVDDLDALLKALSEILDEEVYLKNDTVIIN